MVLDPLGVEGRDGGLDADREEESIDDVVALAAGGGEPSSLGGQFDRAVGLRPHESLPFEPLDDPDDGHVGDPEALGEIGDPTLLAGLDQFGDRLDVVLGRLRRMIPPRTGVGVWSVRKGVLRHARTVAARRIRSPSASIGPASEDHMIRVAVPLLCLAASHALAGEPDIERFLRVRAPGEASVAPDGTVFVRDWPDGVSQLYRAEGAIASPGGPMVRLTDFPDGLSGFSIAPDGSRILLLHQVGGNENMQISMLDPDGGDAPKVVPVLADRRVRFALSFWIPDASGFVYTANSVEPNDFSIFRFDFDPSGAAVGRSTLLLHRPGSWSAGDITRDGSRVLVGQFRSIADSTILELDVATGALTDLTPAASEAPTVAAQIVGYMPDERSVLYTSDAEDGIRRLFRRDVASGAVTAPLPESRFEVEGAAINPERTLLAVSTNEEGYRVTTVYRLPEFAPVAMPEMERGMASLGGFFTDADTGREAFTMTLSNARTPGAAFELQVDGARASVVRPLVEIDDQGLDLASFRLPELVAYRAFDGREIPAFLYLPANHAPGTPIPFVVNYHGGPESQFRPSFNALVQYLVAHGFGVMQPNVRGSSGYGRAFHMLDDYRNRWDSVRDGVDAAEWLVANGYATPGRIATWGGSYGGYMSMATLIEDRKRVAAGKRETPLFGAGVNVVGIVNLVTFLERTAGYRRQLREAEYGPLSDPEFLASVSPMTSIELIDVPVFIAHGFNDPRVPVDEAMQLALALRDRGLDPWVFVAPDEGHGFSKLENRLYFGRRLSAFLRATLMR